MENEIQQLTRDAIERMEEAERIVGFGVWRWDVPRGIVQWSDELHRIYGLEPGEFGGTVDDFLARLHPDDREHVWSHIGRALETGEPFLFQERVVRADGEERVLTSQGRVICDADGAPRALVGVCHDVTDRERAKVALGASERRLRAVVDNTPSVISVKDLDGRYRMVNAEYAKLAGVTADELVGRRCVDVFPPEIAEPQLATDRLAAAEGEPVYGETTLVRDGEVRAFVTVTFALPDEDGQTVETCTIATDVTERKERDTARRERAAWEQRIAAALAEGRMRAYGQPVVDLRTGAHDADELLVRMIASDDPGRVLLPAAFLPAAERYGLVQAIDGWVVSQALARPAGPAPHVNLSAVTMCDAAARAAIVAQLSAAPAAASRIVFEVTETAAAEHLDAVQAFAHDVTALGCRLALDDFGTGYGAFTYLRALPLAYLKIDRSFVRGLVDTRDDRRVVQSIIGIAEQFGLETVAEGIEDERTLELLREMGAHHGQGYHLGRPAPLP